MTKVTKSKPTIVIATVNATRPKPISQGEKDDFRRLFLSCESVVIATFLPNQLFCNWPIGYLGYSTAGIQTLDVGANAGLFNFLEHHRER